MPPAIERASASREPKKPQLPVAAIAPEPVIVQAELPDIEIGGRVLARIVNYDALWNAARARVDEAGLTRIGVDTLSQLPDGYAGKLLGALQVRKIGPNSLEKVLEGIGCFLVLVEDTAATAKMLATAKELGLFRQRPPRAPKLLPSPSPPGDRP